MYIYIYLRYVHFIRSHTGADVTSIWQTGSPVAILAQVRAGDIFSNFPTHPQPDAWHQRDWVVQFYCTV